MAGHQGVGGGGEAGEPHVGRAGVRRAPQGHHRLATHPHTLTGLRKMGNMGNIILGQSQISWTVWSQNNV